jgi:exodeoxyribonuclease-1
MTETILWHDYESFGANPRHDRASQFAAIRTDLELNEIDAPVMVYCRPPEDRWPQPMACYVTGITPQQALEKGVCEAEFTRQIESQVARPGTCTAGYNSIRFDDELTRQLLYRNLYDPYEREWRNGNSRWDLIDVVRMCHALRPKGIQWPTRDDGATSFRLEDLTAANGLDHQDAHDALSDVRATIAMAKLIRDNHPRFFDYTYALRRKAEVKKRLQVGSGQALVYVASVYPAQQGCFTIILPLDEHPLESNGVIVFDLRFDPTPWLEQSAEALAEALFLPAKAAGERLPVSVIQSNRCPMIAPLATLETERAKHFGVDLAQIEQHRLTLLGDAGFLPRLHEAFRLRQAQQESERQASSVADPDYQLYQGGFFSKKDKDFMQRVRQTDAALLANAEWQDEIAYDDPRLPEMLFRYRARNFPSTLSAEESERWQRHCQQWLEQGVPGDEQSLSLAAFEQAIVALCHEKPDQKAQAIAEALGDWKSRLLRCLPSGK